MLNTITIMGRLTADPELRTVAGDAKVANATLAVERDRADKDGKKKTDFIPIVVWRKTGESLAKNCKKGQTVTVTGRLEVREWIDKENRKRTKFEVVVNDGCVYYSAEARRAANKSPASAAPTQPSSAAFSSEFAPLLEDDEDAQLPF